MYHLDQALFLIAAIMKETKYNPLRATNQNNYYCPTLHIYPTISHDGALVIVQYALKGPFRPCSYWPTNFSIFPTIRWVFHFHMQ